MTQRWEMDKYTCKSTEKKFNPAKIEFKIFPIMANILLRIKCCFAFKLYIVLSVIQTLSCSIMSDFLTYSLYFHTGPTAGSWSSGPVVCFLKRLQSLVSRGINVCFVWNTDQQLLLNFPLQVSFQKGYYTIPLLLVTYLHCSCSGLDQTEIEIFLPYVN